MCEFFVKADPILYEARSRTVRIHGVLTSIRLENLRVGRACRDGRGRGLHHQQSDLSPSTTRSSQHGGEVPNFASFLRVTCMRYLRRKLDRGGLEERVAAEPPADGERAADRPPAGRAAVGRGRAHSPVERAQACGRMFWLTRNRLVGSYLRLTCASRA